MVKIQQPTNTCPWRQWQTQKCRTIGTEDNISARSSFIAINYKHLIRERRLTEKNADANREGGGPHRTPPPLNPPLQGDAIRVEDTCLVLSFLKILTSHSSPLLAIYLLPYPYHSCQWRIKRGRRSLPLFAHFFSKSRFSRVYGIYLVVRICEK